MANSVANKQAYEKENSACSQTSHQIRIGDRNPLRSSIFRNVHEIFGLEESINKWCYGTGLGEDNEPTQ